MSNYLEPAHHKDWKDNNYLKISGFFELKSEDIR